MFFEERQQCVNPVANIQLFPDNTLDLVIFFAKRGFLVQKKGREAPDVPLSPF
jgi:hypothetical protein